MVLALVAAVVVAASVILRMMLTRDRLVALIVPRIEKTVDAKIAIGDMGIRFPFGFGVNVKDLSFEKTLPDSTGILFKAQDAQIKVSLISLIKRRPEIGRFEVNNSTVTFSLPGKGMEVILSGLRAGMKMQPAGGFNLIEADADIDSAKIGKEPGGGGLTVESIVLTASLKSGIDFNDIEIIGSKVRIGGIVDMDIKGRMEDLKGARNFAFFAGVPETQLPGFVDWMKKLDFASLLSASAAEGKKQGPLPEVTAGRFDVTIDAEGSFLKPAEVLIKGALHLDGVTIKPANIDMPVSIGGNVGFNRKGAQSDNLDIAFGRSTAKAGFDLKLDDKNRPERVDVTCDMKVDIGDVASRIGPKEIAAAGILKGRIAAGGTPATLMSLFPGKDRKLSREAIEKAWREVELAGELSLEEASFRTAGNPVAVTGLQAGAKLSGGSLLGVNAKFNLGSGPWSATGSFAGILPCLSELTLAAADAGPSTTPGQILDSVRNLPEVVIEIRGRSFDARPFERLAAAGKSAAAQGGGPRAEGNESPADAPAPGAGGVVMLMNTTFTARVDSILTEKALFTSIEADGKIVRGRLNAAPLRLDYAGGKGTGSAGIDLRDPARILSKFEMDFSGVSAAEALGRMHGMGSLVGGTFSFRSKGEIVSGPGLDPLKYIVASGDATSSEGAVDLSPFVSPLSSLGVVDLSGMQKIDFSRWTGKYSIRNGRLSTDDWEILSAGGDLAINGSFGFDGSLDYRAHIVIPPQAQQKMKDLAKFRDMVDLFRDEKGNLVLDLDIGGTAKSPKVGLDQTAAKKKAGEKLIDGLKDGAADKLKDLLNRKK